MIVSTKHIPEQFIVMAVALRQQINIRNAHLKAQQNKKVKSFFAL